MPCRAWAVSLCPAACQEHCSLPEPTLFWQSLPVERQGQVVVLDSDSLTASKPLETSQKEHGICLQGRQDSSLSWDDTPGTATPEKEPRTARPTPAAALANRSSPRTIRLLPLEVQQVGTTRKGGQRGAGGKDTRANKIKRVGNSEPSEHCEKMKF